MSFEKINSSLIPCKCGRGNIVTELWNDDWNRYEHRSFLDCDNCKLTFYLSKYYTYHKRESVEILCLVKKGELLYRQQFNLHSFEEYLAFHESLNELKRIQRIISKYSACNKISDDKTKQVINAHKKYYKTKRLTTVRENLQKAIINYHNFSYNKDNVKPINIYIYDENKWIEKLYIPN